MSVRTPRPLTLVRQGLDLLHSLPRHAKPRHPNGEGVPEDLVFAYMWWHLSAAQGEELARENKDTLERRMTREQIAEAQGLSREWIEAHPQDGGS